MRMQKQGYSWNLKHFISHPAHFIIIYPAESAQYIGLKQVRNDLAKLLWRNTCFARNKERKIDLEYKTSVDTSTLNLAFQEET